MKRFLKYIQSLKTQYCRLPAIIIRQTKLPLLGMNSNKDGVKKNGTACRHRANLKIQLQRLFL